MTNRDPADLWIGVTLTSQEDAETRLPLLMRGGQRLRRFAVVRGAVDLTRLVGGNARQFERNTLTGRVVVDGDPLPGNYGRLDLVIGPLSLRAVCAAAGIAFEECGDVG